MSVTVYLANKAFVLPASEADINRRNAYFNNPRDPKNQLKPEENKILLALGINKEQAPNLTPHLAKFFEQLPKCTTDASIFLSTGCETIQYVLWETLFAARARSEKMYDDNWNTKQPWGDISVAINEQIINDLKPKPTPSPNDIDKLFTLMLEADIPVESEPVPLIPSSVKPSKQLTAPQGVDKLFTLILEGEDEPTESPKEDTQPATAPPESVASSVSNETQEQEPIKSEIEESESIPNITESSSPFTKTQKNLPIGRTASPLTVVPEPKDLENQCEGVDVKTVTTFETFDKEFERSIYFFHSIKQQEPIDLEKPFLESNTQKKFINDWQKAIKSSKDKTEASLKFIGVPVTELNKMNELYRDFIYGGKAGTPSPIKAYDCEVKAETAAGSLQRFIPILEKSEQERKYYFEQSQWVAPVTMVSSFMPTTVDEIGLAVRDKKAVERQLNADIDDLYILTNHDINYSQSGSYNYGIGGKHIHESALIEDIFRKATGPFRNKSHVLDISPRLMYLLYKERFAPKPLSDSKETDTIENHFLKYAFANKYEPPNLSEDQTKQEQIDVAFYEICHAITKGQSNPSTFYSKPIQSKLPKIINWLKSVSNKEYQTVADSMKWAVPSAEPFKPAELMELFQSIQKKPTSFFSRMFTRKNTQNKKNSKNITLKNRNKRNNRKFSNTETNNDESLPDNNITNNNITLKVEEPPTETKSVFGRLFTKKNNKKLPEPEANLEYYKTDENLSPKINNKSNKSNKSKNLTEKNIKRKLLISQEKLDEAKSKAREIVNKSRLYKEAPEKIKEKYFMRLVDKIATETEFKKLEEEAIKQQENI